ncbi:hypothetical protein BCR43DRAFT_515324 [Syncephalastrum racemosum]|uniref:Retrotransposon gag domain-containing protein n=1 Tax=Syncephalastrum racemosum TaxID=13706 RepID=A0A1X2HDR8_SYNRA|nr:hypothetical protein BCR43DRAFT_515324 [Syncephalastrum racemosum]
MSQPSSERDLWSFDNTLQDMVARGQVPLSASSNPASYLTTSSHTHLLRFGSVSVSIQNRTVPTDKKPYSDRPTSSGPPPPAPMLTTYGPFFPSHDLRHREPQEENIGQIFLHQSYRDQTDQTIEELRQQVRQLALELSNTQQNMQQTPEPPPMPMDQIFAQMTTQQERQHLQQMEQLQRQNDNIQQFIALATAPPIPHHSHPGSQASGQASPRSRSDSETSLYLEPPENPTSGTRRQAAHIQAQEEGDGSGQQQQTASIGHNKIQIPFFYGTNSAHTANAWLIAFETACDYNGWDDRQSAREMGPRLQESAAYWWYSLTDDVKNSYALAKNRFIAFFGGGEDSSTAALTELRVLKQGQTPFHTFGPYLRVLLMRAMPNMPENMRLNYLYSTARCDLAKRVMLKQPTTLDAAFSAALIEERVNAQSAMQQDDAQAKNAWPPSPLHIPPAPPSAPREHTLSSGVEPMDIGARRNNSQPLSNVNAQGRDEYRARRPRRRQRRSKTSKTPESTSTPNAESTAFDNPTTRN